MGYDSNNLLLLSLLIAQKRYKVFSEEYVHPRIHGFSRLDILEIRIILVIRSVAVLP